MRWYVVVTYSYTESVTSRPNAAVTPGYGGTITAGVPTSDAMFAANIGPAPPSATSAKSRGS